MSAVILEQVVVAELRQRFLQIKEDWMADIKDYSGLVNNNTINFNEVGALPTVLLNTAVSSSAPIGSAQRTDQGHAISLDKFDTTNTEITDDELFALNYSKESSVMDDHYTALALMRIKKGLYSFGPASDATATPVLVTTGTALGTTTGVRKTLALADIIAFRLRCIKLGIDIDTCRLVLSPEHVSDIMTFDQSFRDRFNNTETGKLIAKIEGFKLYENNNNPTYNNTTFAKNAFGAAAAGTDTPSSVMFSIQNAMRASGTIKVYYKPAAIATDTRSAMFGVRTRFITSPVTASGNGALVSGVN